MIKEQIADTNIPEIHGAYSYVGATTSTSTAIEGLIAALHFIPKEMDIYHEIERSVEIGIDFLLRSQIKDGDFSGAFQYAVGSYHGWRKTRFFHGHRNIIGILLSYSRWLLTQNFPMPGIWKNTGNLYWEEKAVCVDTKPGNLVEINCF